MKTADVPQLTPEAFGHLGENLSITMRLVKDLVPHKTNPRTHSKKQVQQIARSIASFGMNISTAVDPGFKGRPT